MVKSRVERLTGRKVAIQLKHIQDFRNYKVTFDRAKTFLGFHPQFVIEDIIDDLYAHRTAFGDYEAEAYYNIRVFRRMAAERKEQAA